MKKLILFLGLALRLSFSTRPTFAQITLIRDLPIQGDVPGNSGQNNNQTSGGSSIRKNSTPINPYAQPRKEEQARSQPLPPKRPQIRTLPDQWFIKVL